MKEPHWIDNWEDVLGAVYDIPSPEIKFVVDDVAVTSSTENTNMALTFDAMQRAIKKSIDARVKAIDEEFFRLLRESHITESRDVDEIKRVLDERGLKIELESSIGGVSHEFKVYKATATHKFTITPVIDNKWGSDD